MWSINKYTYKENMVAKSLQRFATQLRLHSASLDLFDLTKEGLPKEFVLPSSLLFIFPSSKSQETFGIQGQKLRGEKTAEKPAGLMHWLQCCLSTPGQGY